jgi:hypothetical protein
MTGTGDRRLCSLAWFEGRLGGTIKGVSGFEVSGERVA